MFLRLMIAFVAFSLLGSALFGVIILQQVEDQTWRLFLSDVMPFSLVVPIIAIVSAYWFARRFHRPIYELMDGANRISQGEYGHLLRAGGWGESQSLAQTFNAMSQKLAVQFQQLANDREQLRTILGGMVEGVIAVDSQQRVLFANDTAGDVFEFIPEAAVGRHFWQISRQPQLQEVIQKALEGTQPQRIEISLKGSNPRFLAVYVAPMPSETFEPGAVVVAHDISELRRLERLRQDFVANVSHELKTPLSVIKACVETLLDGAVEDPEAREPFLDQISEQGDRLHALILDLLSLARIESGEELLDIEDLPISKTVEECIDRHRARADSKSIDFIFDPLTMPNVQVRADSEGLYQIVENLIDNAVKYTPSGGKVFVRWTAGDREVSLQVQDTGPGIPSRDLPRIFERFYRVDRARSRELGGTGLGLAIVKHLVQEMQGTIRATSELGSGTTFTVSLPRGKD